MDAKHLLDHLIWIRRQAVAFAAHYPGLEGVDAIHQASAQNLLHYLSVRSHELRELQLGLIELGLSSLGILESHTLATLNSVIAALQCLQGEAPTEVPVAPVSVTASSELVEQSTNALFRLSPPDAREASRELRIVAKHQHARLVATDQTVYLQENTQLLFERNGKKLGKGTLVNVHKVIPPLVLQVGDQLLLTRDDAPGISGERDAQGVQTQPARIHCTLEEAFSAVQTGQQVWLDDGKIGGTVETCDGETIMQRMESHYHKRRLMMRPLSVCRNGGL